MALDEFYQRLADINSGGSTQTTYDEMRGARKRNNQSFYQQLANEKKKMLQFTVSTPHQNYQDQQINQQMGTGSTGNWGYPLSGKLRMTSDFGPRPGHKTPHTGVDWAAPSGTPIYAPGDATVRSSVFDKIYGNETIIDYGGGNSSMFGHQSKSIVKPGQRVKKGQIIGYVGSTGNSTGPHLHFETWVNNNPVNPLSWFL